MYKALLTSGCIFCATTAFAMDQAVKPDWPSSMSPAAGAYTPAPAPVMNYRARDGEVIRSEGADAIPALPLTVMSNGTMKYVTGGIGEEELAQLKSLENDFNVRMLIAGTDGSFVGDVTVRVVDTKDTVLFTVPDAGPYFYLSLPPADYIFEVSTPRGNMRSVKVKAPATGHSEPVVRFPRGEQ